MATRAPPTTAYKAPDSLVSVKINVNGVNKRFRMPIADMSPEILPGKLRNMLNIPADTEAIFERYSDSAADFVTLDPNNVQVYKQLLRAAKAKLRLRLKVTIIEQKDKEPVPAPAPAPELSSPPVTTEDTTGLMTREEIEEIAKRQFVESLKNYPAPALASANGCLMTREEFLERHKSPSMASPTSPGVDLPLGSLPGPRLDNNPIYNPITLPIRSTRPSPYNNFQVADAARITALVDERLQRAHKAIAEAHSKPQVCPSPTYRPTYRIYCNHCDAGINSEHYHCDSCDNGDYDLCHPCVDRGTMCRGGHWMIKRDVVNGEIVGSVTKKVPGKCIPGIDLVNVNEALPKPSFVTEEKKEENLEKSKYEDYYTTCNCCLAEDKLENFVTCDDCRDYDLCTACHEENVHGHHPKHSFSVASPASACKISQKVYQLMKPGRNVAHNAICDNCDKYIYGVRHKCIDCPDWDYCNDCIGQAPDAHPNHRFVPIYESQHCARVPQAAVNLYPVHKRIACDGPLCVNKNEHITGIRYKCAICPDFDLCASCEASPLNTHNITHPLVKFRTPIRSVLVNTTGSRRDGKPMPTMGDRIPVRTASKCTCTTAVPSANASTQVQATADMQPKVETEMEATEKEVKVEEVKVVEKEVEPPVLKAEFVRDTVQDGAILPCNQVFEQTWYLRNAGNVSWPAGCSVRFVGGDNMCANDPAHPASVHELVSAAESTTCYTEVAPGQEQAFTVLMRTPGKPGRAISYWRLTGPDGFKFEHKLWCDIKCFVPQEQEAAEVKKEEPEAVEKQVKSDGEGSQHSQLVFPALVKESPVESVHESTAETVVEAPADVPPAYEEDFVDFGSAAEDADSTTEGFLTDEEYDILDASDQEEFEHLK